MLPSDNLSVTSVGGENELDEIWMRVSLHCKLPEILELYRHLTLQSIATIMYIATYAY